MLCGIASFAFTPLLVCACGFGFVAFALAFAVASGYPIRIVGKQVALLAVVILPTGFRRLFPRGQPTAIITVMALAVSA